MRSLAPRTTGKELVGLKQRTYQLSVIERHKRLMIFLSDDSGPIRKHKEELLGSSTEFNYNDTYNMIALGRELVGSYIKFLAMIRDPQQIRLVAQMIAQFQLSNMVELIQRHDRIIAQNIKKANKKRAGK